MAAAKHLTKKTVAKVLINQADIKSAGGVAPRVRTQGHVAPEEQSGTCKYKSITFMGASANKFRSKSSQGRGRQSRTTLLFPEVGGLHHRYERRVSYCGDRTGGPVSAWGPFLFVTVSLGCNGARNLCMVRSSDQCSNRLIKNRQWRSSSATRFPDRKVFE